jgi:hypothetical protein
MRHAAHCDRASAVDREVVDCNKNLPAVAIGPGGKWQAYSKYLRIRRYTSLF